MAFLLTGCILIYGYIIMRRLQAWAQMPEIQVPSDFKPEVSVSVLIAVRNEVANLENLLLGLAAQKYPASLLEIIIINDHSEDDTERIVLRWQNTFPFALRFLQLDKAQYGKKAAVRFGIESARHALLVFTDGDCRVQPDWLKTITYIYQEKKAKFISGPVCFDNTTGLFQKMQAVEFAGLIGIGASSIFLGVPNMCNGANMAYPKSVFTEINGFAGNEHIASGDDEFVMHKIHAHYPGSVYFLKAKEAVVYTDAHSNLGTFFKQRVRWASKWPAYNNWQVRALAVLVFAVNLGLFIAGLLAIFNKFSFYWFLSAWGLKLLIDFLFLRPVLHFFNKPNYWRYLLPLQIINIPYVVLTALLALPGSYTWKGRQIKS